ncbi:hypothetical protein T03_13137 [Trichinella britovi]|uniref:Uncharacterized protein n=1 Tax=Trichinella britovi TaxID=45882 RepID=A0A0V1D497_TRIBR|nr:hypothetical protein T03_13137 [Trichinella britovi]
MKYSKQCGKVNEFTCVMFLQLLNGQKFEICKNDRTNLVDKDCWKFEQLKNIQRVSKLDRQHGCYFTMSIFVCSVECKKKLASYLFDCFELKMNRMKKKLNFTMQLSYVYRLFLWMLVQSINFVNTGRRALIGRPVDVHYRFA